MASSTPAATRLIPRIEPIARLVDSDRFQLVIGSIIVANAVVLGLETYPGIMDSYADLLIRLNTIFYGVFVVELVLRLISYGKQPWNFFRSGWNVFDFIIIGGALIPAVQQQATVMRLLRLARVVRLLRFLPDARVLLLTVTKSIPSVMSMVVLTILILFLYGMVGWTMLGEQLPQQWGTVGTSMLTLFVLLTLENFPQYLQEAQAVSPFATVFFLSYVLVAAFVVFNLLIGIVIGSMEKARDEEAAKARANQSGSKAVMRDRLEEIRSALEELQSEVDGLDDGSQQVRRP